MPLSPLHMKRVSRFVARTALAIALTTTPGCFLTAAKPMTPQEITQNGTKSFPAPKAKVFKGAIAALKAEGFEIAFESEEKGIIKTGPKTVGQVTGKHQATSAYRQYTLTVTEEGGQTTVVAAPKVGIGQRDMSNEPVWVLEGPAGERAQWAKLFQEITELM
jgi:hypothetical protein